MEKEGGIMYVAYVYFRAVTIIHLACDFGEFKRQGML